MPTNKSNVNLTAETFLNFFWENISVSWIVIWTHLKFIQEFTRLGIYDVNYSSIVTLTYYQGLNLS